MLEVSEFHHFRINHSIYFAEATIISTELRIFESKPNAIYASLTAFQNAHFELYLKECEWRFNHSVKTQISILKQLVKGNLA